MVNKIYEAKNRLLEHLEKELRENPERIDMESVSMLADMVKDLAEAEEKCWEAEYYHSIVDAMDKSGRSGYDSSAYRMDRNGWQNQYGSGYSRMGYQEGHEDAVDHLLMAMKGMNEEEKKHARERLLSAMDI